MCKNAQINQDNFVNNASGPDSVCRLIGGVFLLLALDEGDIALLKTYVSNGICVGLEFYIWKRRSEFCLYISCLI